MKKQLLALLLLALLALTACGGGGESTEGSSDQGTDSPSESSAETAAVTDMNDSFDIILNAQPTGFNPLTTNDSMSSDVTMQIYDTLYKRSVEGTSYTPYLAADMPVFSEDGLTATIKLKEGITFSDGSPFNAESVKYTLGLIMDESYGAARPSIAGSIDSIETPDDYTVVLKLKYPDGVLIAKLAHMNSAMLSPTTSDIDLMVNPIGTGAYVMEDAVPGSEYTLVYRGDDYWGEEPDIKKIKFSVVQELSTAIARLETGEADFIPVLDPTQIARVDGIANINLEIQPNSSVTYLGINQFDGTNSDFLQDVEVRKAIAMAIDNKAFADTLNGGAQAMTSSLPTSVFGYTDEAANYAYAYNPEEAKKIVEEKGVGDEPIVILTSTVPLTQTVAEYVQASLQAVGFTNVSLKPQEFATYLDTAKQSGEADLTILTWSNVTGDGTEYFDPNLNWEMSSKRVKYNDADFIQLVTESRESIDQDYRLGKLDAANKKATEDVAIVPLFNRLQVFAFSKAYSTVFQYPGEFFYVMEFKVAK